MLIIFLQFQWPFRIRRSITQVYQIVKKVKYNSNIFEVIGNGTNVLLPSFSVQMSVLQSFTAFDDQLDFNSSNSQIHWNLFISNLNSVNFTWIIYSLLYISSQDNKQKIFYMEYIKIICITSKSNFSSVDKEKWNDSW